MQVCDHFNRSFSLRLDAMWHSFSGMIRCQIEINRRALERSTKPEQFTQIFSFASKAGSLLVARLLNSSLNFNSTQVVGQTGA